MGQGHRPHTTLAILDRSINDAAKMARRFTKLQDPAPRSAALRLFSELKAMRSRIEKEYGDTEVVDNIRIRRDA